MIVVIPILKTTAAMAERMLDLIYWQHDRETQLIGDCVLCFASDVHLETQKKLLLTAGLSFTTETAPGIQTFQNAAEYISKTFKEPWLYMEPDCVPLKRGWFNVLSDAYAAQPKRFMGPFLQKKEGELFLGRVSIYPNDPNIDSNQPLIQMSRKTRLIQELRFDGDVSKIRPDAVLLHGDRTGMLVESLIAENAFIEEQESTPGPEAPKRRGRPRKTA